MRRHTVSPASKKGRRNSSMGIWSGVYSGIGLHLRAAFGEIADRCAALSGFFQLDGHAGGYAAAETPDLLTLAHEHQAHEDGQAALRLVAVVHELGKEEMGREGDRALLHGKPRVTAGTCEVLLHIPRQRGAD